MSDEPEITANKASHYLTIHPDVLADAQSLGSAFTAMLEQAADPNYVPPPPWEGDPLTPLPAAYEQLLQSEGLTRELVELHGPVAWSIRHDGSVPYWVCEGCEFGGYDGERPNWPCETTAVIARHLGVDLTEAS